MKSRDKATAMSTTDRYRALAWGIFTATAIASIVALFVGKDPSGLAWLASAPLIGEGSHVGKRATFKREAVNGGSSP